MYDSTLFDNLKMLEKEDWKDFKLFVDADFNNKGYYKEETRWLLKYITSAYPDWEHPKLAREQVVAALYEDKPVIAGKFEKMMHELNVMSRNFLLWKEYHKEDNTFNRNLDWLKILRNNVAEDKYLLAMDKTRKSFEAIDKVSPEYYFQKYLLEREQHEWMSTVNIVKNDLNLPEVIKSFNEYYGIRILEIINHTLTQQKITKINLPESIINNTDNYLEVIKGHSNIMLEIYYSINSMLRDSVTNVEIFERLFEFITQNENKIQHETLKEIYCHLRNICNIIIESNRLDLLEILHQIHKDNLNKGYFEHNNRIPAIAFASITKTAIDTGNIEWAINFIESYKNKIIDNENHNEYYLINKSICLFALKDYESVLKCLPPSSKNAYYYLFIRRLEIKSFYALKSDLLQYKIESFKMYLSRASNKFMSNLLSEGHMFFINILSQTIQTLPNDKSKIIKIKTKIEKRINDNKSIIERRWLLEKIQEIL